MKVLIDTCIIVDVLQNRAPFAEDGKRIFLYCANEIFDGYLTAKSVTDIYYIVHRATHDNGKTKEIIKKLFTLFGVLNTEGIDCKKALISETSDYEDAVMIESAIRSKMDCIVTRNEKDYGKSQVKVYTPEQFIKLFEKNT